MAPPELLLAINCTNVGVGPGGTTNLLAKVSIVNYRGDSVYDSFVIPTTTVTDYRTATTGITAAHLTSANSRSFTEVQNTVANHLRNRIIVGYCLWNDLAVLGLPHPAVNTRDVALYLPFRNSLNSGNHVPGLQTLAQRFLVRNCQQGHIEPTENARVCMDLYRWVPQWEASVARGNWACALPPSTFSRCYL
ncbi:hypothetical protein M413DRAFT_16251 [Hebeloma cylindrosporum]|uniref:RNA exonuclease 4 n=1 Tax=Hebeloma cylindrosporum TaxID=76867 RepID=A0A0C3CWQ9_HEBCY|nr:hypothetical protein M413DRAFT_16251 [Hebeloma cylindrosporum h7]